MLIFQSPTCVGLFFVTKTKGQAVNILDRKTTKKQFLIFFRKIIYNIFLFRKYI